MSLPLGMADKPCSRCTIIITIPRGSVSFTYIMEIGMMSPTMPAAPIAAFGKPAGSLLVLADIASRMLIAPQSLPVGVVTALVGVPFFAVIIYRSRNK